jgi:hypothetical protein
MTVRDALGEGRLPNADAVLWATESTIASGPAAGTRAIDVQVWNGIGCRIYPDRGLDIGQAWYRSVPLAWISRIGEAPPLADLEGMAWGTAFGGGLVTTCGLRNVGMPSEGHGLHGTYSHLPARGVAVTRDPSGEEPGVVVTGIVDDPAPPSPLRVVRTVRIVAGTGRIEIEDVTTNHGAEATPAPILYHCNFGHPLWSPPARLEMPVESTTARDPESEVALDAWHLPPDVEVAPERVLEHAVVRDLDWGWARVANPVVGVAVTVRWDRSTLPRLNQWLDPNPGMAVLGVEPANCSTRGRAHDRAAGRLPTLEPGEERTTRVVIEAASNTQR